MGDVHLFLQHGHSPLIAASGGGHVDCVNHLLDKGAEVNHKSHVSVILLFDNCL